jgi:hypothetical protein
MKAKILISYYPHEGGHTAHRIYLERDYEQADLDLKLIQDTSMKHWELQECELYNVLEISYQNANS